MSPGTKLQLLHDSGGIKLDGMDLLWPRYVIGQAIIFLPCVSSTFFLLSFFTA